MADKGDGSLPSEGPVGKLRAAAARNSSTQRLFSEAEDYLVAHVHRLVLSAGQKLSTRMRQGSRATNGDDTRDMAANSDKKPAEGRSLSRAALEGGSAGVKHKLKGAFQSLTGGSMASRDGRFSNVVEDCDVGVPVHVAYNQWTQYQDYSRFTRGVLDVEHIDEVTSDWQLKVANSRRSVRATVTEQIPDHRIVWSTEGAKGTINGVVTFHPLGTSLTRVLLVIEYYPRGFFERTANMWWAASRRARLDLKHYRRFVMMHGEETGAWRGEVRDGEVVRSHEEAVEQEEVVEQEEQRDAREARSEAAEYDDDQDADEYDQDEDHEDREDSHDDELE